MRVGDLITETVSPQQRIVHRLAEATPHLEGWRTNCGSVFRSRAALFHPMLGGRLCERCGVTRDDFDRVSVKGVQRG